LIVETPNRFESGEPARLEGPIVSIRGHDADNDEWEIVIRANNKDAQDDYILPINYTFDRDDVQVTFKAP